MPVSPILRAFHYFMLGRRDGVVFMAEDAHSRRFAAATGKPRNAVILNGEVGRPVLTGSQIDDYRRGVGIANDKLVVGTVGRLVRERRPDIFIDIFSQVLRANDGAVEFLFVGDGAARTETEKYSNSLGLDGSIHFPGIELDAIKPMSAISVYLTLMVGDVSGMAGVQAALTGVPVVGFQLDPAHVRSDKDWIWSACDPAEVAREIGKLLRSDGARQSLADTQQRYAREHYSIQGTADSYEAFLEDVRFPEKAVR
jgi:glycosyltransferase involved in cell wall biosynthesis